MQDKDPVKEKAYLLPNDPGVYQFLDSTGKIIYVGKAKNLRKRVTSYFLSRAEENRKLQVMVKKIADIAHIVTASESDALLLENNFIKKYQPRYNVMLKDDKTYPWICIKNEHFPRIFLTRRKVNDGSRYFGPYTSVAIVRMLLDLIRQIYPLRTCRLNLSPEAIAKKKYSVCLEYHLGNCKGPCEGLQTEEDYLDNLAQATDIIKGNANDVLKVLNARMQEAAKDLRFEEAQTLKDSLLKLENYQAKSVIVSPTINNVDVFSLLMDGNVAYANFLRVVKGAIVQSHTVEMKLGIEEEKETLLSLVITEMEQRLKVLSREIIVPFMPDVELENKTYIMPQRGDKLKLLSLSERNAKAYRLERLKHLEKTDPERHIERILSTIKTDLHLPELPYRIECFDNSNIQGTNPVAACVVFINAKPAKKEYRHFNVKTVEGPNDYASMEEIVYRRYKRVLDENLPLPQLIVVDGGKGQLSAAIISLKKLDLYGKIPILGLAERLEEIYFPHDSVPLHLNKNSETLKVLMHIRDEAHRFGITFHRNKRSANFIKSELRDIKGIGEITTQKLMVKFKTVSAIKKATEQELADVAGKRAAKLIREYFEMKNEE